MVVGRVAEPLAALVRNLRADLIQVLVLAAPHLPRGPFFDGRRDHLDHVALGVDLLPQLADCWLPHVHVHLRAVELAIVDALVGLASEGVDQHVGTVLVERLPPLLPFLRIAQPAHQRRIGVEWSAVHAAVESLDH